MAEKLQCEICGGKLIGRPGGVFECDSCGMEYDTAWAREKIQEIKGTVKVEGTVEVTGTVQVDNSANLQNLLSRMRIAINNGQWDEAGKFGEDALNVDAMCFEAYLGKLLCQYKSKSVDDLAELAVDFESNLNYQNAIRVADSQNKNLLERSMRTAKEQFIEKTAQEELEKQAAEKSAREAREKRIPILAARHTEVAAARRFLRFYRGDPFVLTATGSIHPLTKGLITFKFAKEIESWDNIYKFEFIHNSVLILDYYGNVTLMRYEEYKEKIEFSEEKLVIDNTAIDIGVYLDYAYVLLENGTLLRYKVTNSENSWDYKRDILYGEEYIVRFNNVISIYCYNHGVFCECKDGTKNKISSSGKVEALPEDDTYLLSNRSIGIDGVVRKSLGNKTDSKWDHLIDLERIKNSYYGLMQNGSVLKYNDRTAQSEEVWNNVAVIMSGGITNSDLYAITNDGHILSTKEGKELLITTPLFDSLEALQNAELYHTVEEKRAALATREKLQQINEQKKKLYDEQSALNTELSNLKGLFIGKRRKEIETRLAEIESELKKIDMI